MFNPEKLLGKIVGEVVSTNGSWGKKGKKKGSGSLLGGLATSEGLLLAARARQGFGAALATPAALALITTTFPAGPLRNRAFAVYAAMSGVGAAVGLLLGGWLTGLDSILGYDVEGCLRDGYLTQRDGAVYVTPKGRAAASADRTRVKSGAFR